MAVLDNKKPQPTSVSPVKPQRRGTGFTNLARVMQASQGSKLGQTIAGGLTGQAQQVQSGIKTAQEEFQKEAEKNRVDTEANRAKAATAITQAGTTGIVNPEDLNLFKTIRAAEYKGPTELANQQQLQAQAQQAQTLGSLASGIGQRSGTDQGGRQELLRRFAGGADYTSGQRKLDESILSKDKEANLASAARQTRGVAEEAQRAAVGAQAKGQEYGNLAKIFAAETKTKIGEAQSPVTESVNKKVKQAVDAQAFFKRLKDDTTLSGYEKLTSQQKEDKLKQSIDDAVASGYISKDVANKITGETGLSSFRQSLKNDSASRSAFINTNQALRNLFENKAAGFTSTENKYLNDLNNLDIYSPAINALSQDVNINRQSLASELEASQLNALSLLGDNDQEFLQNRQAYKGVDFDPSSFLKEQYLLDLKNSQELESAAAYAKGSAERTASDVYYKRPNIPRGFVRDESIVTDKPFKFRYDPTSGVKLDSQFMDVINRRQSIQDKIAAIDAEIAAKKDAEIKNKV